MSKKAGVVGKNAFIINGKETFLHSGEMHYFRIPKRYWPKHLQALKDAGCNAVSAYIPWSWHSPKKGVIDLTGKTHPDRDLIGFLDLAAEYDLFVTLKPGPYVLAELEDMGVPSWVGKEYPETLKLDENGKPWGPSYVSYASKKFRVETLKWLRTVVRKAILPRQGLKKGGLVLMQLCNEIGMFEWLRSGGDYCKASRKEWHAYLQRRFKTVKALEKFLSCGINKFSEIDPPSGMCKDKLGWKLYVLWHDFHRWLYTDYGTFLVDFLRDEGIKVPLFTNVGGWVWGRAHEFPLNGTFQQETSRKGPDLVYGIDHIPEFIAPNNLHDGILANQICYELQHRKGPLYSAEFQCGSREFCVEPFPPEMGLFYRLCLIHGMTGMNYYMFSQGMNKKGRGIDGGLFYWFTAVDYKGNRQPMFPVIQELGSWLKQNSDFMIQTKQDSDLGVGYYPDLHQTEFLVPKLQRETKLNASGVGLRLDPVSFRDRAWFDGLCRVLGKDSIPFELVDITDRSVKNLLKLKKLVLVANEVMDAKTQEKLCKYVQGGGFLILYPDVPTKDTFLNPCTILADKLGIKLGKPASSRIKAGVLNDLPVHCQPLEITCRGAKVIAEDDKGAPIGIEKKIGKGKVRFFSFFASYVSEDHVNLVRSMISSDDIPRNAASLENKFHVEMRTHKKQGLLFVGNISRMKQADYVLARDPVTGDALDIGNIELPGQTGMLLPVKALLAKGLVLEYALGELHGVKTKKKVTTLLLKGPEGTAGRIALSGSKKVSKILVDGQNVDITSEDALTTVSYLNTGEMQQVDIL